MAAHRELWTGRAPRWLFRALLTPALAVLAFLAVAWLTGPRPEHAPAERLLDRAVGPWAVNSIPLQVAIHDLMESMPAGSAIGVCRELTNRLVTRTAVVPEPLRQALESLAAQVGATVVVGQLRSADRELPAIACTTAAADYLILGPHPPSN